MTVTIRVDSYGGLSFGQLTEEFPADFAFEGSSPAVGAVRPGPDPDLQPRGRYVRELQAHGTHHRDKTNNRLLGTLEPAQGAGVTVGGPTSVTVLSPPAQQTASATRSFSPSEVTSGGTLTVTIRVDSYGGLSFGQLTEEFPADFAFEGSSPAVEPSGQARP